VATQHGTRLAKDPIPVVTLEDLYLYSLSYMQYSSSSRLVKTTIDAGDNICEMDYSRGWSAPLPCPGKKQRRWRAIALLAVLGDRRLPHSPRSSRRKRRWRSLLFFAMFKEKNKKKKLEKIATSK